MTEESPFKNKTWEFVMTPVIFITVLLVRFIVLVAPVGYEVTFTIRALSVEELDELEDDWDDYS